MLYGTRSIACFWVDLQAQARVHAHMHPSAASTNPHEFPSRDPPVQTLRGRTYTSSTLTDQLQGVHHRHSRAHGSAQPGGVEGVQGG